MSSRPFTSPDKRDGGTLGFFTEDYRFKRAFDTPSDFYGDSIAENDWTAVVEPDYSAYGDWPYAVRLWSLYKSRWCCRFWQELDVAIIPQIFTSFDFSKDPERLYETLPKNIPVMATQCRVMSSRPADHWPNFFKSLDLACNIINPGHIIIYGGLEHEKSLQGELPKGPDYTLIQSYASARRDLM